jgi:uncharacterized protein
MQLRNALGYTNCSLPSFNLCEDFERAKQILTEITTQLMLSCREDFNGDLMFAIQFGSSLSGIPKPISDIDVLFVLNTEPKSRSEMWKLIEKTENRLLQSFESLSKLGHHYSFSPIIRTASSFERFSYFYLDLPEHSLYLGGSQEKHSAFLERIKAFRNRYQAEKIDAGSQLVWNLSNTLRRGEPFDPVF